MITEGLMKAKRERKKGKKLQMERPAKDFTSDWAD